MHEPLLALIEDDPQLVKFLRASLGGFRVIEADTGGKATLLVDTHKPELVLLDLGLPDIDGLELIKRFRARHTMPIIVISARGKEHDKVAALDLGADDYLTKPFGVPELLARVRAALRRVEGQTVSQPVQHFGDIALDGAARLVCLRGEEVHLTPSEYKLIAYLAKNAGKVVTHQQILREVWGAAHASQSPSLRVFMTHLRKKLERDPANPQWLLTEPGVGYRLRAQD